MQAWHAVGATDRAYLGIQDLCWYIIFMLVLDLERAGPAQVGQ